MFYSGLREGNTCAVSGKWNEDAGSVQEIIFWFCVWSNSRELQSKVSLKIPLFYPTDGNLLLKPSASYNKLLDGVAFGILLNIHDVALRGSSAKIVNGLKTSTISSKRLQPICSTGFQMPLQLERCWKFGV